MNAPKLEDFIKTYVENKAKSETREGYADWLMKNGINAEKIYNDAEAAIASDYARAQSGYGKNAEGLSGLGLSGSGYSDYLNGKAYSVMQRERGKAREMLSENITKNSKGYSEYLEKMKKEADAGIRQAINDITDKGFINYDDAYNYAVSIGLKGDDAVAAAKGGSDSARGELKTSIMKTVVTRALSEQETYNYALSLGLTEEEAKELSGYAKNMFKYFDESTIDKIIDAVNGTDKR